MQAPNVEDQVSATCHCGSVSPGTCNEPTGDTSGLHHVAGLDSGCHTYTEIIDGTKTNEQIRYYVDNNQMYQVSESQVCAAAWQAAVDHGFIVGLGLAVGGAYLNSVCGCTSPISSPKSTATYLLQPTISGGVMSIASLGVYTSTPGPVPPAYTTPSAPSSASVVKVAGGQGNWQLHVNGSPYYIKGLTYGPNNNAAIAHMPQLQSMGVNTLRTWEPGVCN